ncbi:dTDP-4-dehydrorhamnose 3,5-epimerase [Alphaproteobacteria bacterium]|nr:dTDP-4-dehydrorhamnose 3,5-epimerase [Alphaproteobacteria bacterium]
MIQHSDLDGVLLITPPTNFEDFRGSYVEIYNERIYKEAGVNQKFIQDDISTSTKNVLRGVHGDGDTWKLVTCLYGAFYLIIVNNDPNSAQFKKWESFTLTDRNRLQVLIPPLYGNGHLVLSDTAIFHYKQTTEYKRSGQFTILWDDPEYNFWWPTKTPTLSIRDEFGG